MRRGGYGPSLNQETAEPHGHGYNQQEGGGEPCQLLLKSRGREERETLSKSSPKLPH